MSHTDIIIDADPLFEIDPNTRAIRNEIEGRNPIIQYDHNSERFGFSMPRYVDGHDMSLCDKVEVHYINIDGTTKEQNEGVYEVKDLAIDTEDENKVNFTWLISQNATQYVGVLSFLIRFSCFEDTATPVYVWNTSVFTGITIAKGMYNGEVIVEQYADILEQWKQSLEDKTEVKEYTINISINRDEGGVSSVETIDKSFDEIKNAYISNKTIMTKLTLPVSIITEGEMGEEIEIEFCPYLCSSNYVYDEVSDLFVFEFSSYIHQGIDGLEHSIPYLIYVTVNKDSLEVEEIPVSSHSFIEGYVNNIVGDIETALDNIIAIQNDIMGVSE